MKTLEKAQFITAVFTGAAKSQLNQEETWITGTMLGLYQGLKYKGSIKTGMLTSITVIGALACANGVYNLVTMADDIKRVFNEDN